MNARLLKVLGCTFAATFLITGCSTPPIILGNEKQNDLSSLSQLVQPETTNIQLVFVHGVGDHCRNYALDHTSGWLNDENLKVMAMKTSGSISPTYLVSNAANLTSINGHPGKYDDLSKIYYQTRQYTLQLSGQDRIIPVQAIEITWSPLTSWIKTRQLGYDSPSIFSNSAQAKADCVETPNVPNPTASTEPALNPPNRLLVNRLLKEDLLDRKLADAMLYAGTYGKTIQRGVADVLCHVSTGDTSDTQCKWPTSVPSDVAQSQYIFVTHSIGSRLIFDTLLNLRNFKYATERNPFLNWFDSGSTPTVLASHIISKTSAVYMMANQLPLLGLANIDPTVNSAAGPQPYAVDTKRMMAAQSFNGGNAGTCASWLGQFSQERKEIQGSTSKLYVVAFNDTNDLLTWHIPPWYSTAGQGPGTCDSEIDLRNVFVQNGPHWFIFENPATAHTGYFTKKDVWQAISCGGKNGNLKDCLH